MQNILQDFPILHQRDRKGNPLVYLDNAATTQKPTAVLDALDHYYRTENANPHRGAYTLGMAATAVLENARNATRQFLHASDDFSIIFTKSATEALNLVAYSYGKALLSQGDGIVAAISEHHSNLVPWQQVAREKGTALSLLYTDESGRILPAELDKKIVPGVKLVAIAHVSNVTGVIYPLAEIIRRAHAVGAVVVVDGTQSAPHMPVDVAALDADFYIFSGHKLLAPMGIGVLCGKNTHLLQMPPFLYGGDMIEYVEEQTSSFAPLPAKFEGGTPNAEGAAGLSAALGYLSTFGMAQLAEKEQAQTAYLLETLAKTKGVRLIGPQDTTDRLGVVSFTVENAHPHDVATILNGDNVAIRAGHHCAQPFLRHLGVPVCCRASLYLYNTKDDIDALAKSLGQVERWLGHGA